MNESHSEIKKLVSENPNMIYLEDSMVNVLGYNVYGSPFGNNFTQTAFTRTDEEQEAIWAKIPTETEILVTHGPPHGILDAVLPSNFKCGTPALKIEVLERVKPLVHCFGHIHDDNGAISIDKTLFLNSAICTARYNATQACHWFDLPVKKM